MKNIILSLSIIFLFFTSNSPLFANEKQIIKNTEKKLEVLSYKKIYSDVVFNDLKSAHFILTFNSGNILTKDIREYLEFDDNIEYSYTIKRNRLYIYGNFKPNKDYIYTIKKGFEVGSLLAKNNLRLKVSFGDLSRNLKFTSYKSYVSSHSQAVEIETTNIEAIDVKLIKVNSENLNYLNLFEKRYLENKYFQDEYNFKAIGETIQKYKKAIAYRKNKTMNISLNLSQKLLHEEDGIYLLLIKDSKNQYKVDSKLIFKSDIGISTKVAKNQMFFFLNSLATNEAIKDAKILVYSKTNKLLFEGKTNSEGVYSKSFQNIISSSPKLVVVKKDKQVNFLNLSDSISTYDILNHNTYNYYTKHNNQSVENQSEYESLVFMERSLLRPSDSANILITVKDKAFKSLKNETIYLQFIEPSQNELFTQKLILNDAGIAEYKFTSFNNYKTGKYRINVLLGKEQIAYKEFYVEAFVPEKIEVNLESSKDKYSLGEKIDFSIKSKYLFGTPASSLLYDLELMSNVGEYENKDFKEYSFNNILHKEQENLSSSINESGNLDENGHKSFSIDLKLNKTSSSLVKTSLIATVYDDGRAIRKFKDVDIFPFENIVGIKKESKGTVKTNEEISFDTILLNPLSNKKIKTPQRLKVKVFKKFYHYYAGEEIREIQRYEINSNEKIKVIPKESGEYYVSVETNKGQISSQNFYASGWSYEPVNIKDKSSYKITVKTNKKVYKKDDTVSIDLKSPISGKLLLTIEEDEILDYKVIDLNTTSASIEIPFSSKIKKGAYVKAYIIRDTQTSDEIFPFRVIGFTYIKKDNTSKKIDVKIDSKNLYKSGDEVLINVSTNQDVSTNSYAVISMVDMGILNIINEKATDAFLFFDKQNKDNISLYDLYSNLQKINKLNAQGVSGDGIQAKREKHISPDAINERIKPLSFWSKIIKLDKDGKGNTRFKLPNFNGQVLVQALVINDSKIGSSNKNITIKDDIVIKPTLPRFLIKNDNAIIPLRLLNTTKEVQNINLSLQASSNLNLEKKFQKNTKIVLNPKESKVLEVEIRALKEGLAKLIFKASNDKDNFTNEISIYIKDNLDYELVSKSGIVNKNQTKEIKIIDADTKRLNTEVKAYLGIDNSPFSKLSKSSKYLISYPHGCVEQTSSKLLAMLMSENFIDKNDKKAKKLLFEREIFIKEGIQKILSMQNSNGFFTYWSGTYEVNNYASFYTTYVLQILSENGFEVPKKALEKAFEAHWDIFKSEYKNLDFFYAFASKKDTNMIYDNSMYGNTLTSYVALAASMKKYNNEDEYKTLIIKAKNYFKNYDISRQREYSQSFYSPIKDIASALYLYTKYISDDLEDNFSKDLLRTINNYIDENRLYSTQDKAFVMLALNSYYKDIDTSITDINASIKYENELKDIKAKTYEQILVKNNDSLSITNQGGLLNYILDINKPLDLEVNANSIKQDAPIFMKADIIRDDEEALDYENINLGDKLFMKVTVKSNKTLENVAVNIQIPAGLEIINPRLYKSNNQKFQNINYMPDYEDYRDDRVLSYFTSTKEQKIFFIPLIATTKGEFIYPASYIEVMYDTRINAYYKPSKKIVIK